VIGDGGGGAQGVGEEKGGKRRWGRAAEKHDTAFGAETEFSATAPGIRDGEESLKALGVEAEEGDIVGVEEDEEEVAGNTGRRGVGAGWACREVLPRGEESRGGGDIGGKRTN